VKASKVMSEMTKKISASAFGALLAVMLLPAGPARADSTDSEFAAYLESHGISLGSPTHVADLARTMCTDLENGNSQNDEVEELMNTKKLSEAQANAFVGAATADYCPAKHAPAPPRGDG
jgi:Protein of unknown function (DUF732)